MKNLFSIFRILEAQCRSGRSLLTNIALATLVRAGGRVPLFLFRLILLVMLIALVTCQTGLATEYRFKGGSYDGYDRNYYFNEYTPPTSRFKGGGYDGYDRNTYVFPGSAEYQLIRYTGGAYDGYANVIGLDLSTPFLGSRGSAISIIKTTKFFISCLFNKAIICSARCLVAGGSYPAESAESAVNRNNCAGNESGCFIGDKP